MLGTYVPVTLAVPAMTVALGVLDIGACARAFAGDDADVLMTDLQ